MEDYIPKSPSRLPSDEMLNEKGGSVVEHILQFLNPQWHYGPNITIRLGDKWHQNALARDTVVVVRTGEEDKFLARGVIESIMYIPFLEVSLSDLLEEHDPECRTPHGLVYAMLCAYPDFKLSDMVTVIRFII